MKKSGTGQLMIIVGLAMVVFLGFAALAIDLGRGYSERRNAQNAADAAALAGMRLARQQVAAASPMTWDAFRSAVAAEVAKNGGAALQPSSDAVVFLDGNAPPGLTPVTGTSQDYSNVWGIRVKTQIPFATLFTGFMGVSNMTSGAVATARSFEVPDNTGLLPIALQTRTPGTCTDPNYGWTFTSPGNAVDIPFGLNNPGNFGWVDFTRSGAGASTVRDWIRYGYSGPFNYYRNLEVPPPLPAKKTDPWDAPDPDPNECDGYYQDGNAGGSGTWDVTPPNGPDDPIVGTNPTDIPHIEWFGGDTGISTTLIQAVEAKVPGDFTILIFNKIDKGGSNARYQVIGLAHVHIDHVLDGKDGKHLIGTYGGTTFGGTPTGTPCIGPLCTVRLAPNP